MQHQPNYRSFSIGSGSNSVVLIFQSSSAYALHTFIQCGVPISVIYMPCVSVSPSHCSRKLMSLTNRPLFGGCLVSPPLLVNVTRMRRRGWKAWRWRRKGPSPLPALFVHVVTGQAWSTVRERERERDVQALTRVLSGSLGASECVPSRW